MKYFIAICSFLIILLACKEDKIVNPKITDQTDSLYILGISPEFGIAGTEVNIIGKGFGDNPDKIKIKFGENEIEPKLLTDTLIMIKVPELPTGKYKISVEGHDSIAVSLVDFEIVEVSYKFSKTELWFRNIICEVHYVEDHFEFLGSSYKIDTTYQILTSSVYFLLDKLKIPKGDCFN